MIDKINLKNFKAFLDIEINLSRLSLLTGGNGLGKSSVIQALLLLRQSFQKGLFPNRGILLNGELINIGKGSDVMNIHSESKEINFSLHFDDNTNLSIDFNYLQDADFLTIKNISPQFENTFQKSIFTNGFKYLNAERVSPKVAYNVSLFEVEQNKSLGIHGEYTSLFISKFQREEVKLLSTLHPKSDSKILLDQISAWLGEISPGVSINSRHFPDIDAAKFTYQYQYGRILTPEFSPSNVGFGLTYVLPVITSILASKPGDLLIIENPESHLHPAGQSKLGELLFLAALDKVQIIIETHSDHILNGIRVAINKQNAFSEILRVLFFERDYASNKHISKILYPKIDNNGQIDSWPNGFFDQSVNDLNFLLGL
jgi:predicted ATPase